MKAQELLDFVSREEKHFLKTHSGVVKLASLNDRDKWLAQNLVRRGIIELSKDNMHIVVNHENIRPVI